MKTAAEWKAAWDARAPRERALMLGCALVLPVAGVDALVTAPMERRLQREQAEVATLRARLDEARLNEQKRLAAVPALRPLREQEARWRERLALAQTAAREIDTQAAEAARLPDMLRAITGTVATVRVVALDLGAAGAASPARAAPGRPGPTAPAAAPVSLAVPPDAPSLRAAWRLPITLTVAGSYPELTTLMGQVEQHAGAMHWTALSLDATEWPSIRLTLKAHVPSTQPRWGSS